MKNVCPFEILNSTSQSQSNPPNLKQFDINFKCGNSDTCLFFIYHSKVPKYYGEGYSHYLHKSSFFYYYRTILNDLKISGVEFHKTLSMSSLLMSVSFFFQFKSVSYHSPSKYSNTNILLSTDFANTYWPNLAKLQPFCSFQHSFVVHFFLYFF